jgi:DNA-directed RNA polymerase specialized sigma24 family protein
MSKETEQMLDDIARLLSVILRSTFETQTDAIEAMSKAGLTPTRIAGLLGTSSATVRDAVSKAKKR